MSGKYNLDGFQGTVVLKNWMRDPITGRSVMGVMGKVTVTTAKDAAGFEPSGQESNWIARVEGPDSSYNFPGCQVRCIVDHGSHFAPPEASEIIAAP